MLINVTLEDDSKQMLIGSPQATMNVWVKVDGFIMLEATKNKEDTHTDVMLVPFGKKMVVLENVSSLAQRVNDTYRALGGNGSFISMGAKGGN